MRSENNFRLTLPHLWKCVWHFLVHLEKELHISWQWKNPEERSGHDVGLTVKDKLLVTLDPSRNGS